jgi:hypothetical protein
VYAFLISPTCAAHSLPILSSLIWFAWAVLKVQLLVLLVDCWCAMLSRLPTQTKSLTSTTGCWHIIILSFLIWPP